MMPAPATRNKKSVLRSFALLLALAVFLAVIMLISAPMAGMLYDSSDDGFLYNLTEGTNLGIRNLAPVLFMDFNTPAEHPKGQYGSSELTSVSDNSVYNSYGLVTGTRNNSVWWVPGNFSNSLEFDGKSDFVDIPYNSNLVLSGAEWTFSAWIYPYSIPSSAWPSSLKEIYGSRTSDANSAGVGIALFNGTNTHAAISVSKDSWTTTSYATGSVIDINKWHYIAITYKNSTNMSIVYMNGTNITNSVGNINFPKTGTNPRIGLLRYLTGTYYPFHGRIDELMIFNRTLSDAEILDLYQNQSINVDYLNNDSDLKSYWRFNETSGNFTLDEKGTSNGTLKNYEHSTPMYNSTGGYDGSGAYTFDGFDDVITVMNVSAGVASSSNTTALWYKNSTDSNWTFGVWLTNGTNYTNGDAGNPPYYPIYKSGEILSIGKTGATSYFNGTIDHVQMFPYLLSGTEVLCLYNGTGCSGVNNTDYIGSYARSGDYISFVFHNSASPFWNISLSLADSYSAESGVVSNNSINLSDTGLVGYWAFDGNFDDSLSRNNGTGAGINNATGISSRAMRFSGTDAVTTNSNIGISGNSSRTISFWVYVTGEKTTIQCLTQWGTGSWNTMEAIYFDVNTDDIYWTHSNSNVYTANNIMARNAWHHITTTYDGTAFNVTSAKIFIDGVSKSIMRTGTTTGGLNTANTQLTIGNDTIDVSGRNLIGAFDELAIYNRTLSEAEVTSLYKLGLSQHAATNITLQTRTANSYNLTDANLVAFYSFNSQHNANNITIDETGRYNGTYLYSGTSHWGAGNGSVGGGYDFDGVDDRINITGMTALLPHTISFWWKGTGTDSDYIFDSSAGRVILGRMSGTLQYHDGVSWKDTGEKILFNNKWHYLAVVTGSDNRALFFIDGKKTDDLSITSNALGGETKIGSARDDSVPINGQIDEFRIYDKALSAAEIQNLYEMSNCHITGWSAWQDAGTITDGIAYNNTGSSAFMQFRTLFNTNDTKTSPYLINHTIISAFDIPVLNITYPLNTTYTINVTQLNFTLLERGVPQACWYSLDNGATNTTITCGQNATGLSGTGGSRTWSIYANNSLNAIGSASITFFANSPPAISSVALTTTNASRNDTTTNLTAAVSVVDADKDNITFIYSWYRNDALNATTLITESISGRGLVGYWPLNNDTLDYWAASDGENNGANLNTSGGKVGGAYTLDGTSDWINLSRQTMFESTNINYSVAMWVKANTLASLDMLWNYDRDQVAGNDNSNYDIFAIWRGTYLGWGYLTGCELITSTDLIDNEWHHLVFTAKFTPGVNAIAEVYEDGVLKATENTCTRAWNSAQTDYYLRIGDDLNGGFYDGTIDEVIIFNRSLSADEVQKLYLGGNWSGNSFGSSRLAWNDTWIAGARAGDYLNFGSETNSSSLAILDVTLPDASLSAPANNTYTKSGLSQVFSYLFNETYSISSPGIFNNTNFTGTIPGIGLVYNNLTGDFKSKAFYYSPAQYWNIILGINNTLEGARNVTLQTRTANNYNLSDGSLVAFWSFNNATQNATGNLLYDEVAGGRNNGTITGAVLNEKNGTVGMGGYFDGNDYVNVSDADMLDFGTTASFAISVWAKTTSNNVIIEKYSGNALYGLWGDEFHIRGSNGVGTSICYFNITATGIDGKWHHFVGMRDTVTDKVYCYLDGAHINNVTDDTTATLGGTAPLTIGVRHSPTYWFFVGSIDELRIYNRTLSVAEITDLYDLGSYHINWNSNGAWSSEETATSGVGKNTTTSGKFMQFKANFNTNTTGDSPYLLNHTVGISAIGPNVSLNLTASLTDAGGSGIKNATLYVYNSSSEYGSELAATNSATGILAQTVGVVINFVEGIYSWFYNAFDFAGNLFVSGNRTLTIDLTAPVVNFTNPTPANGTGVSVQFSLNISAAEANLANVSYNWNGNITLYNLVDNASFFAGSAPNLAFNLTQTGLGVGTSYYYNVTVTDLAGNKNTTETRWILGNAAPSFASIGHRPNASANSTVDPRAAVLVEANISDIELNFNYAILQWKNYTAEWDNATNVTMVNFTATNIAQYASFNASFVLPDYQDNISFRIWANDTLGQGAFSAITNLTSYWDCTWALDSTALGASSGWDINKGIGNITINNTGDVGATNNCSLSFQLVHDLTTGRIYFDNWVNNQWLKYYDIATLTAKSNQTIVVNATFLTEIRSDAAIIKVNEISSRSETANINVSATIITNKNGPYLYQEATTYPSTVNIKSNENFTLNGYIRNIMGDDTAGNASYNVSFNWSLAAGFTNASGKLNVNFSNLSSFALQYNQINVTFSSLASTRAGTKNFTLYGSGVNITNGEIIDANNNSLLTNLVAITFLCYNVSDGICVTDCGNAQDSDCPVATTTTTVTSTTTSGGGSGGGGGGASYKTSATYELMRGKEQKFTLKIENKGIGTKENINVAVSGINSKYLRIINSEIEMIPPESSADIEIEITAPAYFTQGKHMLTFDITGTVVVNSTRQRFDEKKYVTLYIVEVSREEADTMLDSSKVMIDEMQEARLVAEKVSKLLADAKASYDEVNFLGVKSGYEKMKEIYDAAFEGRAIIEDLEKRISEAEANGIDVLESKKLLYVAEIAFNRGDYLPALEGLKKAKLTYALEVKGEFNVLYAVKNNPLESLGIFIAASAVGFAGSLVIRLRLYKRKLKLLQEEEKLLLELMKVVQRECFENKHMSMEEYREAMSQYETRLSETIEDKVRVETKLANLLKLRGKRKALSEEKKRLIELIKEAQDDYLNKGKTETRVYENMLKSYTSRLSEVEEQITFIEAQKALQAGKFYHRALGWAEAKAGLLQEKFMEKRKGKTKLIGQNSLKRAKNKARRGN